MFVPCIDVKNLEELKSVIIKSKARKSKNILKNLSEYLSTPK